MNVICTESGRVLKDVTTDQAKGTNIRIAYPMSSTYAIRRRQRGWPGAARRVPVALTAFVVWTQASRTRDHHDGAAPKRRRCTSVALMMSTNRMTPMAAA